MTNINRLKNSFQLFVQVYFTLLNNGPGLLNITFGSEMPITLLHLMLMGKIYVVNSDMKNVIGMSDLNVMFKGPGSLLCKSNKKVIRTTE